MYCKRPVMTMFAALLVACGAPDHEAEIREFVSEAEAAAEERDTGFFRSVISEDFVGPGGLNRDRLIDRVRGYFLVNNQIEIVNRVHELRLLGDTAAEVELQAALVGRGANNAAFGIDADLYRIQLELVRVESGWQIIGAQWGSIVD